MGGQCEKSSFARSEINREIRYETTCDATIVLDDFGLAKLNADHRRDLLELLEDRYATRSTSVTNQLPIEKWHDWLGDPTFADAILDRLVHNAYKLKLRGGSMRKKKASLTQADH